MDERVIKFRVGVMVLATLIILATLVLLFGETPAWFRPTYTLFIHFPQAPGVAQDTPVRKDGILIGRVHDVRFADEDAHAHNDEGVVVTVKIDGNRKLRRSEIPRISASLLGDAVVQFVKGDRPQTKKLFQDSDYIEGSVANNPLQALNDLQGNIGEAITSVSTAGNEVGKLAQHLDRLITSNDEQIGRIVNKTEHALDGFQQTLANINSVFGMDQAHGGVQGALQEAPDVDSTQPADPAAADFRRRTATLPEVLREARDTLEAFRGTIETADRNLKNLEGFTGPLGQRGEKVIARIDQSVGRLDELLQQFVLFGQSLNRREGSLGQLVNNPDLYQHLNTAACNIEELTRELRPIVRDARAFSDKIARHPESLGVRGALKPSSGIK